MRFDLFNSVMPVVKARPEPFKGKVRLNQYSTLRKLMRAASRGMLDDDRQRLILSAIISSARGKKHKWQRTSLQTS